MNKQRWLCGVAILSLCVVNPARAYVDPGTGSMLLQVLGASIAGAIFYFRELRIKFRSLFRRQSPGTESGDKPPDEPH